MAGWALPLPFPHLNLHPFFGYVSIGFQYFNIEGFFSVIIFGIF